MDYRPKMYLFAYASNMNVDDFKKRVPSARKVTIARLPGYVFTFTLTADDQSSKASITASPAADAEVWGVVIEYADAEQENFYYPDGNLTLTTLNVFDEKGEIYKVNAFIPKPHAVSDFLLPYDWYLARIVKTAREAGLPDSYVNALSRLDSKVDPDEARRARELNKD